MMRLRREDPRLVGPYRLHRRLGTGGMGVVFLGSDRRGQKVALKLIRPELAEDQEFRTRFAREVAAAARIRGGCIARLVASDIEAERPWLATAYVPGPSLYSKVGDEGPLPWTEVAAVGAALAEGLTHVHEAGVVHRDLKPSNILLSPKGPRIIDFGIAWSSGASTLTHVGTAVGSPGFLAPEQVRGVSVTGATDVFALGSTLTYAATGDTPFGSGSSEVMLYRVVHEEPDLEAVPPALAPLIRMCLSKEPAARPSPAHLFERLRELVAQGAAIDRATAQRPAPPAAARRAPLPQTRREPRTSERTQVAHPGADAASPGAARSESPTRRTNPPAPAEGGAPRRPVRAPLGDARSRQPQPHAPAGAEDRGARPPAARRPAPSTQRTPPPTRPAGASAAARRRRMMRQRLIVFVTVTAAAALAIAAAQGCENKRARGLDERPSASPASSTTAVASAVPAGLIAAVAGDPAIPTVDWSNRSYQDPSDGSRIDLVRGRSATGGAPVTLTAVLPAHYGGAPAAVVVLTRHEGAAPEDMVELYGLHSAEPVLLAAHASTGDPNGTGAWHIDRGAIVREERVPSTSGDAAVSTTRFTVAPKGTMKESWPGAPSK